MLKVFFTLAVLVSSPNSFAEGKVDQVCRDGVGSVATVSVEGKNYKVAIDGPAEAEFARLGLIYSDANGQIDFQSPLQLGPWGARIFKSDQYLTQVASWEGSALVVRISKSQYENLTWRFESCERF